MSATFARSAIFAAALSGAVPPAASAETPGDGKSERGMPQTGAASSGAKSERAMPDQTKDAGTPPAAAERAMPSPDKK